MNIKEILSQPEGRRLEFKAELPVHSDLAKIVVAFANDAGGDLYIGVADDPREVVGLDEDKLMTIEEKVSNIIFDCCYPAILPEIKFISVEDKHLIQVTVSEVVHRLTTSKRKVSYKEHLSELVLPIALPMKRLFPNWNVGNVISHLIAKLFPINLQLS